MKRKCLGPRCGRPFESVRSNAKFCSSACRSRAYAARKAGQPVAVVEVEPPASSSGLEATVRTELEKAERLDTVLGRQAVALAGALEGAVSGGSVASLSRELRVVMEEALRGSVVLRDGLDEMAARRAQKAASA